MTGTQAHPARTGPDGYREGIEHRTRRWVRVPALVAPVALIGGWTLGAGAQRDGYSSISGTISDLAATTARDRWLMTGGFVVCGLALLLVALGLGTVRAGGRGAIGVAGVGVLFVAALPLPGAGPAHTLAAFVALGALAIWPLLGYRTCTGAGPLAAQRMRGAAWAGIVLLVWTEFASAFAGVGGLVERLLAGGAVVWIAVVVFAASEPDR